MKSLWIIHSLTSRIMAGYKIVEPQVYDLMAVKLIKGHWHLALRAQHVIKIKIPQKLLPVILK